MVKWDFITDPNIVFHNWKINLDSTSSLQKKMHMQSLYSEIVVLSAEVTV